MSKRLYLTCAVGEWRPIKEFLKRCYPKTPIATAAKLILLELSNYKDLSDAMGKLKTPVSTSDVLTAPDGTSEGKKTYPSPGPARANKILKKKERIHHYTSSSSEGESEGERDVGEDGLASIPITRRIIGDLNTRAGTTHTAQDQNYRQLIGTLLQEGFTEQNFLEVHRKRCLKWKGDPEWEFCLNPKTLYKPDKFPGYLGELDPRPYQPPKENKVVRRNEWGHEITEEEYQAQFFRTPEWIKKQRELNTWPYDENGVLHGVGNKKTTGEASTGPDSKTTVEDDPGPKDGAPEARPVRHWTPPAAVIHQVMIQIVEGLREPATVVQDPLPILMQGTEKIRPMVAKIMGFAVVVADAELAKRLRRDGYEVIEEYDNADLRTQQKGSGR